METLSRETLELFVEQTRYILSFSFTEQVRQKGGLALRISHKQGEETKIELVGPNREAYAAFILLLRFFIQRQDRISILWFESNADTIFPGAMEALLNDQVISDDWKQGFQDAFSQLAQLLDQTPPEWKLPGLPTRKVVLETFIYGDFAHWNTDKRARLFVWRSDERRYKLYAFEFATMPCANP